MYVLCCNLNANYADFPGEGGGEKEREGSSEGRRKRRPQSWTIFPRALKSQVLRARLLRPRSNVTYELFNALSIN